MRRRWVFVSFFRWGLPGLPVHGRLVASNPAVAELRRDWWRYQTRAARR